MSTVSALFLCDDAFRVLIPPQVSHHRIVELELCGARVSTDRLTRERRLSPACRLPVAARAIRAGLSIAVFSVPLRLRADPSPSARPRDPMPVGHTSLGAPHEVPSSLAEGDPPSPRCRSPGNRLPQQGSGSSLVRPWGSSSTASAAPHFQALQGHQLIAVWLLPAQTPC